MIEVPVTINSNSMFDFDLDGKRYTLRHTFNARLGLWSLDLYLRGEVLVLGAAAVMGVELFHGNALPDVPQGLYLVPLDRSTEDAGFGDLGSRVKLMRITAEDGLNVPTV